MKIIKYFTVLMLLIVFVSCSSKPPSNDVDVTAKDYYFYVSDSIPSGWTTFHFKNEGHATHFFFLTLLPDSITFERYHKEVLPPFVTAMDSLEAGRAKQRLELYWEVFFPNGTHLQKLWVEPG